MHDKNWLGESITEIFRRYENELPDELLILVLVGQIAFMMSGGDEEMTGRIMTAMVPPLQLRKYPGNPAIVFTEFKGQPDVVIGLVDDTVNASDLDLNDTCNVLCAVINHGLRVIDPGLSDEEAKARVVAASTAGIAEANAAGETAVMLH